MQLCHANMEVEAEGLKVFHLQLLLVPRYVEKNVSYHFGGFLWKKIEKEKKLFVIGKLWTGNDNWLNYLLTNFISCCESEFLYDKTEKLLPVEKLFTEQLTEADGSDITYGICIM